MLGIAGSEMGIPLGLYHHHLQFVLKNNYHVNI